MSKFECVTRGMFRAGLLCAALGAMPVLADTDIDAAGGLSGAAPVSAPAPETGTPAARIYERVNGKPITLQEYNFLLAYTLKADGGQDAMSIEKMAALHQALTEMLENHILLLEEAGRRGLKPVQADVDRAVAFEEEKNKDNPAWQENHARLLEQLKNVAAEQNLLDQLEAAVKKLPEPATADVRAYYESHPALFTEPEKMRLSVILLKVAPDATDEAWQQAMNSASEISGKIKSGAGFGDTAKKFSADKTAAEGGDMGYLHLAEMPQQLKEIVETLKAGDVSAPIKEPEGIFIYRLEDRIPPDLKSFEKSEKRAAGFLMRERREHAWTSLIATLRKRAKIELVNTPKTPPAS